MVYLLEEYAKKHKVPIMQPDGIAFLCQYIKQNNIKKILEIGTAIGYSAIKMALLDDNIYITTIERDKIMYQEAIKNIKKFNLESQINVIHDDALNINLDDKYDLIFIDAAKSQYIRFFEKYKTNLKDNGVIVTDNLSFHGMVEDESKTNNRNTKQLIRKIKKYIDFLKQNECFETVFYKLGDGISISKRIKNHNVN